MSDETPIGSRLGDIRRYNVAIGASGRSDADRIFNELVEESMRTSGKGREEAGRVERDILAYYAGYYDRETRIRVESLFECEHPFFGKACERSPTYEEALKMGEDLGRRAKEVGFAEAMGEISKRNDSRRVERAADSVLSQMASPEDPDLELESDDEMFM